MSRRDEKSECDAQPQAEKRAKVGGFFRAVFRSLFWTGLAVGYVRIGRPRMLRWGATDVEIKREYPGDKLTPEPDTQATRAITVNAPVAEVWPWLLQLGQERGGFYSYSWLENLFGAEMKNVDRVVPEFQQARKPGDTVWLATPKHYNAQGKQIVAMVEPERALVLVNPPDWPTVEREGRAPRGSWAFYLYAVNESQTRLIVRSRSGVKKDILSKAISYLVFDPAHFIMERGMMLGMKRCIEASRKPAPQPAQALRKAEKRLKEAV